MSATPAGTDRYLSIETAEDIGRAAFSLLNREVWSLRSQLAEALAEIDRLKRMPK